MFLTTIVHGKEFFWKRLIKDFFKKKENGEELKFKENKILLRTLIKFYNTYSEYISLIIVKV